MAAVYFTVFTLFKLIASIGASGRCDVLVVFRSLFAPLALAFVGIVLSHTFLEGTAALVRKSDDKQE